MSLDFPVTYSFRPHHGPGVDSAPSENEYQEHFLAVKAAGTWGWQPHHLHVPNVTEIWDSKPPGTLWTTPGLLRNCFTLTKMGYVFYSRNAPLRQVAQGWGGWGVQYFNLIFPAHQMVIIMWRHFLCFFFVCGSFRGCFFSSVQLTCNLILAVTVHFIRNPTRNNHWFICFGCGLVYIIAQ